jgi:hypothetical protein
MTDVSAPWVRREGKRKILVIPASIEILTQGDLRAHLVDEIEFEPGSKLRCVNPDVPIYTGEVDIPDSVEVFEMFLHPKCQGMVMNFGHKSKLGQITLNAQLGRVFLRLPAHRLRSIRNDLEFAELVCIAECFITNSSDEDSES